MGLIIGGVPPHDLILDGQSVSLYVGGSPPVKAWPTRDVVQITLGTGYEASDAFRAALSDRGLDFQTVTKIPFDIELVGSGSTVAMFNDCWALTTIPEMDTSQVTNMAYMFSYCSSLTSVPDMDTAQVTDTSYMLYSCSALTDGNVRLIGRNQSVVTTGMILNSGLTREPWYNADGTPDDGPTAEVHEVSLTKVNGSRKAHPLLSASVPVGVSWRVRIQGTIAGAGGIPSSQPFFRIGTTDSGPYGDGAVDFSGTVNAANSTIAMVTNGIQRIDFVGTVTIEK